MTVDLKCVVGDSKFDPGSGIYYYNPRNPATFTINFYGPHTNTKLRWADGNIKYWNDNTLMGNFQIQKPEDIRDYKSFIIYASSFVDQKIGYGIQNNKYISTTSTFTQYDKDSQPYYKIKINVTIDQISSCKIINPDTTSALFESAPGFTIKSGECIVLNLKKNETDKSFTTSKFSFTENGVFQNEIRRYSSTGAVINLMSSDLNANKPAGVSAKLIYQEDNNIIIQNANGQLIWSADKDSGQKIKNPQTKYRGIQFVNQYYPNYGQGLSFISIPKSSGWFWDNMNSGFVFSMLAYQLP